MTGFSWGLSPAETPAPPAVVAALLAMIVAGMLLVGCGGDDDGATPATGAAGSGVEVSYREAGADEAGVVVVFLHGAAYDSSVWERTGILDAVAEAGHRAVAIDLPGKGSSSGSGDVAWLDDVLDHLGIDAAVIVSPSASGALSLPYLVERTDRVAGYVPVAPVGGGTFTWPGGDAPPTLVVLGEDDTGFADGTRALAQAIPGAQLLVVPDAGHAAYEDRPELFTDALLAFLSRPALSGG